MKKLVLAVGTIVGVLLVAAAVSLVKHTAALKPATFKIGQLRPWCTAFAISDTVAATAQHCVSDFDTILRGKIDMYEANDTKVNELSIEVSKHPALDVALLKGNFKDRFHLPVSHDRFELDPADKYDSCGFPMMGPKLVCSHVFPQSIYADASVVGIGGPGYLIFGMSGGPVFNTTQGVVVAVNTGLYQNKIILSPFVNLEAYTTPPVLDLFQHQESQQEEPEPAPSEEAPHDESKVQHLDMEMVTQ